MSSSFGGDDDSDRVMRAPAQTTSYSSDSTADGMGADSSSSVSSMSPPLVTAAASSSQDAHPSHSRLWMPLHTGELGMTTTMRQAVEDPLHLNSDRSMSPSSSEYVSSPDTSPAPSPSQRQQQQSAAVVGQSLQTESVFAASAHARLQAHQHHMWEMGVDEWGSEHEYGKQGWMRGYLDGLRPEARVSLEEREAFRKKARRRQRHTRGLGRGNRSRTDEESASPYSRSFDPTLLLFDPSLTWVQWGLRYLVRPLMLSTINVLATDAMTSLIQSALHRWTTSPVQEVMVTQIPSSQSKDAGTHVEIRMPVGPIRRDTIAPGETTATPKQMDRSQH